MQKYLTKSDTMLSKKLSMLKLLANRFHIDNQDKLDTNLIFNMK